MRTKLNFLKLDSQLRVNESHCLLTSYSISTYVLRSNEWMGS